jgi:hypothetical protein
MRLLLSKFELTFKGGSAMRSIWCISICLAFLLAPSVATPSLADDGVTANPSIILAQTKKKKAGTSTCGNGKIDANEQCDGASLGGKDCTSQGYSSGSLRCTSNCTFDVSGCMN